ncbi:hypothetical protein VTO42DRAFT_1285 [Malbranchea cinnamomea]
MASLFVDSSARSLCRACSNVTRSRVRLFNSSASLMASPESPSFIDIPTPIQPTKPYKPEVKGVLPVPREIFPKRRPDKPSETYIEDATPLPQSEPQVTKKHPDYEYLKWKKKLASTRRKNLREGLLELYARKKETEKKIALTSKEKLNYRKKILTQPMREDERLTRASTVTAMEMRKTPNLPDPNAEERLAKSMEKVAIKQLEKREERLNALHSLYTNARHFITNEKQLMEEIERVFPEGENPAWTNDQQAGQNIWNLGPPPTIEKMVARMHDEMAKYETVQKRTKKIAEELTGGKI